MRAFKVLLEAVAWLNIFIAPTAIAGVVGYIVKSKTEGLVSTVVLFGSLVIGGILGIILAEKSETNHWLLYLNLPDIRFA